MKTKVYRGDMRREISFPVGGIGAGCIGLDGYGRFRDWEIFNRPNKLSLNGYSHFAVRAEKDGKVLDVRMVNADAPFDYMGEAMVSAPNYSHADQKDLHTNYGYGPSVSRMAGMPHFKDCTFEGAFPFAKVKFEDEAFPGDVSLEAFNPFIPLDEDNSSLPAGFYTLSITNTQDTPIDYTYILSLSNPLDGERGTRVVQNETMTGIELLDDVTDPDDDRFRRLMMAVDAKETVSYQQNWLQQMSGPMLIMYWHDLNTPGPLKNRSYPYDVRRATSTLAVHATVQPGETRDVRFVIAWYMPNFVNYWKPVREEEGIRGSWKTFYATKFASVEEVAGYALSGWTGLLERTRAFQKALYESDLPDEALDAVGANISTLKTQTCLRLTDGSFYGFEGCQPYAGSCEGSCTHVWNYAFALPFLFPKLERSMREVEFIYNQRPDGGLPLRVQTPLGRKPSPYPMCVDGQMGTVIKAYRDWKISKDNTWLETWWPKIRLALEFAWAPTNEHRWDPGRTGVITGRQHHTLDMELFGPNAWLNTFYSAALKAAAEMADYMGETENAQMYRELSRKGREYTETELFNGEYFFHKIDLNDKSVLDPFLDSSAPGGSAAHYWIEEIGEIQYQIGEGCGIDQVLAQWMSDMSGLGEVLDSDKVRSALKAIYKYNFCPELRRLVNPWRVFGLNDEAGTIICSWPESAKRPLIPALYSEETFHGMEYQAASHMIAHGMEEEGLTMVRAVRDRYDGKRRNPRNEMECGSNYARSMSSYALLLVYSGFRYDIPAGRMGFIPMKGEGKFFWSVESAWGTVEITKSGLELTVIEGELMLKELTTGLTASSAALDGEPVGFAAVENGLRFAAPVTVKAGQRLKMIE